MHGRLVVVRSIGIGEHIGSRCTEFHGRHPRVQQILELETARLRNKILTRTRHRRVATNKCIPCMWKDCDAESC